jgi:hypothetical protein
LLRLQLSAIVGANARKDASGEAPVSTPEQQARTEIDRLLQAAGWAVLSVEFVRLYNPANRFDRTPTWSVENPDGRWRAYEASELMARDKASLDIFWLRDETLADSDNLPPPDVIAQEIVDDLEAALEQFRLIAADLGESQGP